MELLGDWVMWNLVSVHLATMLVLVQDGCMICAKHTIGSEIMVLLHDEAQVEAHFDLFGDSANFDAK
jgi:hypothetical protein